MDTGTDEINYFKETFWNYYKNLEKRVLELRSMVAFRKQNFRTCSDEIISLILLAGAEFDHLSKFVCGFELDEDHNIEQYKNWFVANWSSISNTAIEIIEGGNKTASF